MSIERQLLGGFDHEIRHLYVHIPFCPKVCPYCSFYKEASDRNKTRPFLEAVLRELDMRLERLQGRVLRPETIFFGGGTPSALSVAQLEFLLGGLRSRLDIANLKEWTLEMNPATVSLEKARLLREVGINRVSMGVQSWDADVLKTLGRVHTALQAEKSYEVLREAGFKNVNLDLMFAVPGQTESALHYSLEKTIHLAPEHISAYCLTYEEDTEFFRRLEAGTYERHEEIEAAMFELVMETLKSAGYSQYEISNYSRTDRECLHNLGYWEGHDYLGLGPSAWSTIGMRRWRNVPDTKRYIEMIQAGGDAEDVVEDLKPETRRAEQLAFGLRTNRGVARSAVGAYEGEVRAMIAAGLLMEQGTRVVTTHKGRFVVDAIGEVFV